MTARSFHIGDLLTVVDGRLVSPNHIGGVYEVVDFVTGQQHMTHQLGRAAQVVKPWLLEQHPWLTDVEFSYEIPDGASNEQAGDIIATWLAGEAAVWGEFHEVEPMPFGAYVGREPIAELREMAPHAEIISVELPGDES